MSDTAEANDAEFMAAIRKLPRPVTCFANGAACPWCGDLHATVTFGINECAECSRKFCFGYPDWHEGKDPVSWVNFPWKEWDALGQRADLIENWTPNKRLQQIYFQQAEDKIGVWADTAKPN